MLKKIKSLLTLLAVSMPALAIAQTELEAMSGDSTIVAGVKAHTSEVYDRSAGIKLELQIDSLNSTLMIFDTGRENVERLLFVEESERGTMSSEWFYHHSNPVFLYRTFEYSEENPKEALWKNFKGLWAWEARIYFKDGIARYQKVRARQLFDDQELKDLPRQAEIAKDAISNDRLK